MLADNTFVNMGYFPHTSCVLLCEDSAGPQQIQGRGFFISWCSPWLAVSGLAFDGVSTGWADFGAMIELRAQRSERNRVRNWEDEKIRVS